MPPAKGRGRGATKANQTTSGTKFTVEVRDRQPPESLAGFQSIHLTNLDDCVSIFSEILPAKWKDKQVNLQTNRTLVSFTPSNDHENVGILNYIENGSQTQVEVYKKTIALMDPY